MLESRGEELVLESTFQIRPFFMPDWECRIYRLMWAEWEGCNEI